MSAHHPFTLPQAETAHELRVICQGPRLLLTISCLNGYELGGKTLSTKKTSKNACSGLLGFLKEEANDQFDSFLCYGLWFPTIWWFGH